MLLLDKLLSPTLRPSSPRFFISSLRTASRVNGVQRTQLLAVPARYDQHLTHARGTLNPTSAVKPVWAAARLAHFSTFPFPVRQIRTVTPLCAKKGFAVHTKEPIHVMGRADLQRTVRLAVETAFAPVEARLQARLDSHDRQLEEQDQQMKEVQDAIWMPEHYLVSGKVLALVVLKRALKTEVLLQSSYDQLVKRVKRRPLTKFPLKLPKSASPAENTRFKTFRLGVDTANMIAAAEALATRPPGLSRCSNRFAHLLLGPATLKATVKRGLLAAGLVADKAETAAEEAKQVYLQEARISEDA
ncbi:hypothetical protein NBRC10512_007166 [Rhodotorula toruloides]|uniref:RHTO0S01e07250g1_1 n=2 Tax=Rhodotorula toruloides TaxID=5286 RepID=A0A061AM46_RHOTO|nr:uncharacterized protein RHTO_01366 [Rhodotorula toruloides NP11]EMS21719.1 hypothetical protein RHTO_01366 [Rhodotorula toruloides NP11]CDR35794.1 RHTO0S01e07250g1_1 [Rhodotorula toruloides]